MTDTKRCYNCGMVKPISEFWRVGAGTTETRPSCKSCLRMKQTTRQMKSPVFSKVVSLLEQRPMTSLAMAEHIAGYTPAQIAGCCRFMNRIGTIGFVSPKNKNAGTLWFLRHNPPEIVNDNDAESERLCRGIPIDQEDLDWMEKYRRQAAAKKQRFISQANNTAYA